MNTQTKRDSIYYDDPFGSEPHRERTLRDPLPHSECYRPNQTAPPSFWPFTFAFLVGCYGIGAEGGGWTWGILLAVGLLGAVWAVRRGQ